jgi:hypothetical protein
VKLSSQPTETTNGRCLTRPTGSRARTGGNPNPEQVADAWLRASGGPGACREYPFKFRLEEVALRESRRGPEAEAEPLAPEAQAVLAAAHLTPPELGAPLLAAATGHEQSATVKARRKLRLAMGRTVGQLGARPAELMQPKRRPDGVCRCKPGQESCLKTGLCPHRSYLWQ